MNSVNKNLERYQQQIIRKQRLENITKNLLAEKQELETKMNELSKVIFDNESDKENFAGVILSSVYYKVAGKSMEKVDAGEREKYVAVVKYDLMRNELINIDRDIIPIHASQIRSDLKNNRKYIEGFIYKDLLKNGE